MKVAVTAVSGQLGSEIVKATTELVSAENVIGLARTPSKAKDLGVEIRPGDYNDRGALESRCRVPTLCCWYRPWTPRTSESGCTAMS